MIEKDEDIVKALACCTTDNQCWECPARDKGGKCAEILCKAAIELIKRLMEEIKALKAGEKPERRDYYLRFDWEKFYTKNVKILPCVADDVIYVISTADNKVYEYKVEMIIITGKRTIFTAVLQIDGKPSTVCEQIPDIAFGIRVFRSRQAAEEAAARINKERQEE